MTENEKRRHTFTIDRDDLTEAVYEIVWRKIASGEEEAVHVHSVRLFVNDEGEINAKVEFDVNFSS